MGWPVPSVLALGIHIGLNRADELRELFEMTALAHGGDKKQVSEYFDALDSADPEHADRRAQRDLQRLAQMTGGARQR